MTWKRGRRASRCRPVAHHRPGKRPLGGNLRHAARLSPLTAVTAARLAAVTAQPCCQIPSFRGTTTSRPARRAIRCRPAARFLDAVRCGRTIWTPTTAPAAASLSLNAAAAAPIESMPHRQAPSTRELSLERGASSARGCPQGNNLESPSAEERRPGYYGRNGEFKIRRKPVPREPGYYGVNNEFQIRKKPVPRHEYSES
ncbi:hypothetical protein EJ06DRAFT_222392 [Trichodelitschia bisporula]|uniref:Uncharacterized protein n=1 Tax=Trichodelitschia bisporula TaxID=703511 RepID=A0A6G1HKB2_9PEZI|nr:hypothetical protein EJ06DRAFT_222392 [Trichodelitschia bisporula]